VLAPLYDILSAQPALGAKQIQRKQMKLAMAVGKSRHYTLDSILPRHYLQSAALSGFPEKTVREIFEELIANGESAIDATLAKMPGKFPRQLADTFTAGVRSRLVTLAEGTRSS
jgi:serine/threonine-protein kinase HipA